MDEFIEIKDANQIYENIINIIKKKKGMLLLDFYSYYSFDEIIKIERVGKRIFKLYWKNMDVKLHDKEIFKADYLYTLVKIHKIKKNKNKIYIMANLLKRKKVRRILDIKECINTESSADELFSQIDFIDGKNKIHSCIISDMPFYSMRISNKATNFSKIELYYLNMLEICQRFDSISLKINEIMEDDEDEIGEKGNSLRKILERVLKLYIILKQYYDFKSDKEENNYDRLQLARLMNIIKINDDKIGEFLNNNMRILANKFSHDSGEQYLISDLKRLRKMVNILIKNIFNELKKTIVIMN